MILFQISAAQGPEECCLAVAKALQRIEKEIQHKGYSYNLIEAVNGGRPNTFKSILLSVEGEGVEAWSKEWEGTLKWIHPSPYRPRHPRKNWFIGVKVFIASDAQDSSAKQALETRILYEACRASGPGGQHVNKTDSAIRATHVATGISVKVQTARSQHANKKLAALLITQKLAEITEEAADQERSGRHLSHNDVERGAAKLVFRGENFTLTENFD
jgi:peptide chain release factor